MKIDLKKKRAVEPSTIVEETALVIPVEDTSFDFNKALEHRDNVVKYLIKFQGQPGHNPWIVIRRDIDPLNRRIAAGEVTKNLYDNLMALELTPPVV